MQPNLARKVKRQQNQMKERADKGSNTRILQRGDTVLVKNFGAGPTWLRGQVQGAISPSMFEIKLSDGRSVRRHTDHTRRCSSTLKRQAEVNPVNVDTLPSFEPIIPAQVSTEPEEVPVTSASAPNTETNITEPQPLRTSTRNRCPPVHLKDYVVYK